MKSTTVVLLLSAALIASLTANVALGWAVVDQAVSLDGRDVYAKDCDTHRDGLDRVLRATAWRADVKRAGARDVSFQFDEHGRYVGSHYGASMTKRFRHDKKSEP